MIPKMIYSLAFATADVSTGSTASGVMLWLVCDDRLSDRLNVSRKLRSDDKDVDFLCEVLTLFTSSSLSLRTYKFPILSLIISHKYTLHQQLT